MKILIIQKENISPNRPHWMTFLSTSAFTSRSSSFQFAKKRQKIKNIVFNSIPKKLRTKSRSENTEQEIKNTEMNNNDRFNINTLQIYGHKFRFDD